MTSTTCHLPGCTCRARVGLRPVCLWCGASMPVPARPQGGGRTKRYCSPRCRTAAHRGQAAPHWAPDTLHAALGVEPGTV